jgi:hypothetical protein
MNSVESDNLGEFEEGDFLERRLQPCLLNFEYSGNIDILISLQSL